MTAKQSEQVEQLFHAALQLEPSAREEFLQQSCGADEELRQAVERLLRDHAQAEHFLSAPVWEAATAALIAKPDEMPNQRRLGHYQIISMLGKGGMGEVWLAQDLHLGRKVAIKLLPPELTNNHDRLRRFGQEARAASALNHPNILTIYDIDEEAGTHFIATEYIDGQTVRQRLANGRLLQAEAIDITVQISAALAAAHEAGIVHRDIKPENVMVRRDRLVKVLDFGLAKLTETQPLLADSQTPTRHKLESYTEPGALLGTPRYMSPEQARGQHIDARTDIFSIGVMLYEMLAGQPPFNGVSAVEVLAAILEREPPPLTDYLPDAPPELVQIVNKSLRKDRSARYQSVNDLLTDLNEFKEEMSFAARRSRTSGEITPVPVPAPALPPAVVPAPRVWPRRIVLLALPAVLLLGTLWWWLAGRSENVDAPPPTSLKIVEAVRWRGAPGELYSLGALSPDGKMVAFTSSESGGRNLWLKQLGSGGSTSQARQITNDEFRNDLPIWSPDGAELAFYSRRGQPGGIWRMAYLGGQPTLIKTIADDSIRLRYWSPSGATIYYEASKQLFALDVKSGQTTQLTTFDTKPVQVNSFNISLDEKLIVYITSSADDRDHLWVVPTRGGSPKQIVEGATEFRNPVWHPDNQRIIYSASQDGVYQLFAADIEGRRPAQLTFGEVDCFALDVARDGSKVLYGAALEESDIWGVHVADGQEFAVTSDIAAELWPDVAPDGKTLAYQSIRNLSQANRMFRGALLIKAADGKDAEQPLQLALNGVLPKWAPNGKYLAFMRQQGREYHLWTVRAVGGEEQQLTTVPSVSYGVLPYLRYQASDFSWSPDSNQLAYLSPRGGQHNLWLVAADGSNDRQITDNRDGDLALNCPLWSSDGQRLVYSSRTNKTDANGKQVYGIWLTDAGSKASKQLLQSSTRLRLIGWSHGEQELIYAAVESFRGLPTEVVLTELSIATGAQRTIAILPAAYFHNIHLAADQKTIAYTSRQEGKDNVWLLAMSGGAAKKLTANNDPRLYFSSLSWAPDGRTLYFGKQTRHSLLSLVTNFK
jgi:eukaryotic-like serine/threonine-protein kinase